MVISLAQIGQGPIAAGRSDERDAERQAITAHGARYRNGGVIEQIDKVGVRAEVAVQRNRVCQHRVNSVMRRRGRYDQHIHRLPKPARALRTFLKAMLSVIKICSTVLSTLFDDGSNGLHHLRRIGIEK